MKTPRTDLQRFQVGDGVRVTTIIWSRYSNRAGVVVTVDVNRHARTLDKYVVLFDDKAQETFWDVQLELSRLRVQAGAA